ncbi:hypothetical protein A9R01_16020 ['Osedax' symbiont bacterium Rs2_46_30_T18]|nr:hypothetical protein A9R01_16020 ['Osedax' symbiont bacterium Rs2_46_30_T18]
MINKKYAVFIFAFFMALFMSSIMSLVITLLNVGFIDNIFSLWIQAWGYAFCVAFPAVLVIAPLVRKIVALLVN